MTSDGRRDGAGDGVDGDQWWRPYVEDETWHRWYRKQFDRRFAHAFADPENACAEAIERLLFRKLPGITLKNRDNLDALVRTAFGSVCKDLIYAEHGKIRAPLCMRRLGPPIETTFRLFCFSKRKDDEIAEELQLSLVSVQGWTKWLKEARKCPERIRTDSLTGALDPNDPTKELELPDERAGPDPTAGAVEHAELADLLGPLLAIEQASAPSPNGAPRERLAALREALRLDDDERLLLRLAFFEDLAPKEIGSFLGMEVHTVRRRMKALIGRIRKVFAEAGLGLADFEVNP